MNHIAGIIPARFASTRFPGKPLHLLAGKPLIQHVWERCMEARRLDRVIVATDDMRIAGAAFDFGAEVALTSADHQNGTDRIAEVARHLRKVTHILNIQGDEPLIDPRLIDLLAARLTRKNAVPMVTAASEIRDPQDFSNSNVVKVVLDRRSRALYFSRSPIPFDRDRSGGAAPLRHQGIYGYSRAALLQFVKWSPGVLEHTEALEQLRALENGMDIEVVVTESHAPGVDTPEDAIRASAVLAAAG